MDIKEIIRSRKSVRSFDGRTLTDIDRQKLTEHIRDIKNPYDIPVEFVLLDAKENGLFSPVITGEKLYVCGKVPKITHCEEAFGYAFEKFVLYAWSLGIGTTWIGGTMKRELFEKASHLKDGEIMPCISPLGYPAAKRSLKEIAMRTAIKADKRLPDSEIFFENDFSSGIVSADSIVLSALEAVKLAPSAVNKQPWRILKKENDFHFYKYSSIADTGAGWDVQKVDIGIALCHFISVTNGKLSVSDPGIQAPKKTEYIATVSVGE